MKLKEHGKNISNVEISAVTTNGLWIFVKGREYFLPFDEFPWFEKATIEDIMKVELFHGHHLYWKELDVDLDLNTLNNLEQHPLISKN